MNTVIIKIVKVNNGYILEPCDENSSRVKIADINVFNTLESLCEWLSVNLNDKAPKPTTNQRKTK